MTTIHERIQKKRICFCKNYIKMWILFISLLVENIGICGTKGNAKLLLM